MKLLIVFPPSTKFFPFPSLSSSFARNNSESLSKRQNYTTMCGNQMMFAVCRSRTSKCLWIYVKTTLKLHLRQLEVSSANSFGKSWRTFSHVFWSRTGLFGEVFGNVNEKFPPVLCLFDVRLVCTNGFWWLKLLLF